MWRGALVSPCSGTECATLPQKKERRGTRARPGAACGAERSVAMSTIEKSIDVHVPVHTAYNQWTQFEEFPRFMEGVRQVKQLDDKRLHWCTNIGGKEKEWDAEITEQIPDQRIAWRNISGTANAGVVTFHRLDDDKTR